MKYAYLSLFCLFTFQAFALSLEEFDVSEYTHGDISAESFSVVGTDCSCGLGCTCNPCHCSNDLIQPTILEYTDAPINGVICENGVCRLRASERPATQTYKAPPQGTVAPAAPSVAPAGKRWWYRFDTKEFFLRDADDAVIGKPVEVSNTTISPPIVYGNPQPLLYNYQMAPPRARYRTCGPYGCY